MSGGISRSGYSFALNWAERGTVTFENNRIVSNVPAQTTSSATIGTGSKVDLTNYKTVLVHAHDDSSANPTDIPIALDVTNVNGSYYIGVSCAYGDHWLVRVGVSGSKAYIGESQYIVTEDRTPNPLAIDSIQLIEK